MDSAEGCGPAAARGARGLPAHGGTPDRRRITSDGAVISRFADATYPAFSLIGQKTSGRQARTERGVSMRCSFCVVVCIAILGMSTGSVAQTGPQKLAYVEATVNGCPPYEDSSDLPDYAMRQDTFYRASSYDQFWFEPLFGPPDQIADFYEFDVTVVMGSCNSYLLSIFIAQATIDAWEAAGGDPSLYDAIVIWTPYSVEMPAGFDCNVSATGDDLAVVTSAFPCLQHEVGHHAVGWPHSKGFASSCDFPVTGFCCPVCPVAEYNDPYCVMGSCDPHNHPNIKKKLAAQWLPQDAFIDTEVTDTPTTFDLVPLEEPHTTGSLHAIRIPYDVTLPSKYYYVSYRNLTDCETTVGTCDDPPAVEVHLGFHGLSATSFHVATLRHGETLTDVHEPGEEIEMGADAAKSSGNKS